MIGGHLISHWCRLQDRIALSSGEAELYAGVRGISEGINLLELMKEMDPHGTYCLEHNVDATACKGILLRHGAGGLKHLETKVLWSQERITQYGIKVNRIPRELNPADLLASPSGPRDMARQLEQLSSIRRPRDALT